MHKLSKKTRITVIITVIMAIPLIVMSLPLLDKYYVHNASTQAVEPVSADTILNLVNQERIKAGLGALAWDSTMESTAFHKTMDMVEYDYFAHERDGVSIMRQAKLIKPECEVVGENLGYTNQDAETLVKNWMDSPTHRENILGDYTTTGISAKQTTTKQYGTITKVTEHFCKLK